MWSASLVFLFNLAAASEAVAQDLVITNARIIVGNGQVIERGSVVVRAGRIVSVAPGAAAAQGAPTIDARGHDGDAGLHRRPPPHHQGQRRAVVQGAARRRAMQEFLDAGYTTLMSGGGPVPGIIQLKDRIDKGELKGPRIITSGRADPANFKTEEDARAQVQLLQRRASRSSRRASTPAATDAEVAMLADRRRRGARSTTST